MYDITKWKHMFKLDPAKSISDENLEALCMSNTDAIIIGGTDDVTEDNVIHLMSRVRRYPLPLEGYVVLNANSKVAKITKAYTQLGIEDVEAYAQMAEELYRFPIMYVEYSGTYGDVDKVKAIANMLQHTQLFYGGGITNIDKANEMSNIADTIVVGDIIYNDIKKALKTVKIKESNK